MNTSNDHIWLLRKESRLETAWAVLASLSVHVSLFLLLASSDLDNPLRGSRLQFDIVWIGDSFAANSAEQNAQEARPRVPESPSAPGPRRQRELLTTAPTLDSEPVSHEEVVPVKEARLSEDEDRPKTPDVREATPVKPVVSPVPRADAKSGEAAMVAKPLAPEVARQKASLPPAPRADVKVAAVTQKTAARLATPVASKPVEAKEIVPPALRANVAVADANGKEAARLATAVAPKLVEAKEILPAPRHGNVTAADVKAKEAARLATAVAPKLVEAKEILPAPRHGNVTAADVKAKEAAPLATPVAPETVEAKEMVPSPQHGTVTVADLKRKKAAPLTTPVAPKPVLTNEIAPPARHGHVTVADVKAKEAAPLATPVPSKPVKAKEIVPTGRRGNVTAADDKGKGSLRLATPVASKAAEGSPRLATPVESKAAGVKQLVPPAPRGDAAEDAKKGVARSVAAEVAQGKGLMLPAPKGDLKMKVVGEGVKLSVLFKDHPSRLSKKGRGAVQRMVPVTPVMVDIGNNSSETVIERAQEGVYVFAAGPVREEVKAVFTFRIFEGTSKERMVTIGRRTIAGKTELIKILMPEAVIWSDDKAFTGTIEDSDSTTKFNSDTGLYWKEYHN